MAFFILPQTATLTKRKASPTRDRSGQLTSPEHDALTATTIKCLFYGYIGGKNTAGREDFDQTVAFYCEGTVDIDEGDQITNIAGKDSFEAGPFEVLRVTPVTNFSGKVHHFSCKLKGSSG